MIDMRPKGGGKKGKEERGKRDDGASCSIGLARNLEGSPGKKKKGSGYSFTLFHRISERSEKEGA